MSGYAVPARRHRVEQRVRKSRFIVSAAPTATVDAAKTFVAGVKAEFPDASHNCWAFNAGPPGDAARVGMSDDGEPRGSAGRPMLDVLRYAPVGEIGVVVTRYFGGVKLGRGGLARAYGGGVKTLLETLPTQRKTPRRRLRVRAGYAQHDAVRRLAARSDAVIEDEIFGTAVELWLAVPADAAGALRDALRPLGVGVVDRG